METAETGETFLNGGKGIIAGPMKFIFLCNDIDTHSVTVAAIYDIIERVFSRMETRESVLEDRRVHYSFLLRYTNVNILSSSLIPIVRREWLV